MAEPALLENLEIEDDKGCFDEPQGNYVQIPAYVDLKIVRDYCG